MPSPSPPPRPSPKKKTRRRAGSCESCRKSKIKCDGKLPECTACSRKKPPKNRDKDPCVYIPVKNRSASHKQQVDGADPANGATSPSSALSTISEDSSCELDTEASLPDPHKGPPISPHRGPPASYGGEEFFGPHGLARCIEKFKSICPPSGSSSIPDAVTQCTGIEAFNLVSPDGPPELKDLSASRAKHSLSHFLPSTDLRVMPPEIRCMGWKAINIKERMLDQGRIFEAYKEFPSLAREALIFRRLNTKQKSKTPGTNPLQAEVEKKIYRLIVDMDIRICMHIGTTLEVQPEKLPSSTTLTASDSEPPLLELERSQSEFRQLAFEILEILPRIPSDADPLVMEQHISDLSAKREILKEHCSKVTTTSEVSISTRILIVEHEINCLALSMLLACSLGEMRRSTGSVGVHNDAAGPTKKRKRKSPSTSADYAKAALEAAQEILALFADLEGLNDSCTWTSTYAVFSATAIASIAVINGSMKPSNANSIRYAVEYFRRATRQQRNEFYGLAYAQLDKLWAMVKVIMDRKPRGGKNQSAALPPSPLVKSEAETLQSSPARGRPKRRNDLDEDDDLEPTLKRARMSPSVARPGTSSAALTYGLGMAASQAYNIDHTPTYGQPAYGWIPEHDGSGPASLNTSFSSAMPMQPAYDVDDPCPAGRDAYPMDDPWWVGRDEHLISREEQRIEAHPGLEFLPGWWQPPLRGPLPPQLPLDWYEARQARRNIAEMNYHQSFNNSMEPHYAGQFVAQPEGQMVSNMPASSHGLVNEDGWSTTPAHNYDAGQWQMSPQEARRMSAASQEDSHAAYYGWQPNSYSRPMTYGEGNMPTVTEEGWRGQPWATTVS